MSAGFGAAAAPFAIGLGLEGGTAASAIIGGTASVLGGGRFANGAVTGAFGYLYNACGGSNGCKLLGGMKLDPTLSQTNTEKLQSNLAVAGATLEVVGVGVALTPAAPAAPFIEFAGYAASVASIGLDPTFDNILKTGTGYVGKIIQPFSNAAAAVYNQYHIMYSTYDAAVSTKDHRYGN
jgi:hypothetical protein